MNRPGPGLVRSLQTCVICKYLHSRWDLNIKWRINTRTRSIVLASRYEPPQQLVLSRASLLCHQVLNKAVCVLFTSQETADVLFSTQ